MSLETMIIERIETFARHPVFAGSDQMMLGVLDDLESKRGSGLISSATYGRLRDMILGSPHLQVR